MSAKKGRTFRPANSPEAREGQLASLAYDLAEKQLKAGTASAQVIVHFLKAVSRREELEQSRIENDNLLLAAKIEAIKGGKRLEELFDAAIKAMRTYSGQGSDDD